MPKSKRKAAKGKPITSHPLFPAVVAFWFGALFGLGSLAIRPGLIEDLVLNSGLDLIIPAAAPPLGNTARILIALTMASTGALIGGLLARRLTRAKAEAKVSEHDAATLNELEAEFPTRRPISAHDELGASLDAPAEGFGLLGGRRRALAVEEEEHPFQLHELAPLPGGEPPVFARNYALAASLVRDASPPSAPTPAPATLASPMIEPANRSFAGREPPLEPSIPTGLDAPVEPAASPRAELPRPADLGLTDLARRLQESMARRRAARQAGEPAVKPLAVPVAIGFEPDPALAAIDQADDAEEAASPADYAFGSLLSISPSLGSVSNPGAQRSGPVRIEEPEPTVATIEPLAARIAKPAVDSGEAEAALRAALANLQRISGAA